ncbi:hypothetical protein TPHA_0M02110 [Tetrapisispora phaffii CBS 4417]|uniref:Mso1 N-terminal domain-containing protein n=1 Tax=Tetrapisispora phaffii (strain ATCC 24235 / CBS 4417 / NBRC 1672 / NRRL Y-8282 / UCD 70-5) TaxID=1071381 RepID=G8C0S0_TETPH|nr:hypothetical protein TPHA_0M02110 [Tetrapisispora phaffii CBS 4417]CCE65785.1 hypothetical protein TPHA_0M02110 [Tetrapisispora phaffii CBS 4417]
MSAYTSNSDSDNLWNKFTKSTKSISNSLSQLSVKSDSDGNSIETTLVHKALVKYYQNQQPFQGFPGWLGHKEDLPDENKILKKQMGQQEKLQKKSEPSSGGGVFMSTRNRNSYTNMLNEPIRQIPEPTPKPEVTKVKQKPTASMSFQSIYSSFNDKNALQNTNDYTKMPTQNLGEKHGLHNQQQTNTRTSSSPERSQSSSSLMMRDRLKKQTRNGFGFQQ